MFPTILDCSSFCSSATDSWLANLTCPVFSHPKLLKRKSRHHYGFPISYAGASQGGTRPVAVWTYRTHLSFTALLPAVTMMIITASQQCSSHRWKRPETRWVEVRQTGTVGGNASGKRSVCVCVWGSVIGGLFTNGYNIKGSSLKKDGGEVWD